MPRGLIEKNIETPATEIDTVLSETSNYILRYYNMQLG